MTKLSLFAKKWCHPDYKPTKVELEEIRAAEHQLNFVFPDAYVRALIEAGAVSSTRGLLHVLDTQGVIEDSDVYLHDLSELYVPQDAVAYTFDWRALGMPEHLVAIGRDCMGNKFCFSTTDQSETAKGAAAIYFWDHDFLETIRIADDFESWIQMYLAIEGNYDSWKDD